MIRPHPLLSRLRSPRWLRGLVAPALIAVAVIGAHAEGGLEALEHRLMDLRFHLTAVPPSGDTVLVDIDARSLAEVGVWPWPRRYHADVIRRLADAGAKQIAVDVDFSARTNVADDAALVAAVQAAEGRVVLPAFKQWAGPRRDVLVYTAPFAALRDAAEIAAVNLRPAGDNVVRRYQRFEPWQGDLMPAFAQALQTGRGVNADDMGGFYLDYGIHVEDVPRLSFVDILNERFDPSRVAGKTVIIGATAIELGDQVAAPLYGALAGAEIQALARESLHLGRAVERTWVVVPYALALLAAFAVPAFRRASWWTGLAAVSGASIGMFLLSWALQAGIPLSLDITPPVIALWLAYGWALLVRLEVLAEELFKRTMEVRDRSAMLTAVLRENADGVLLLDDRLNVMMINPAACRLLRVSERTAIGRPAREVMPLAELDDLFAVDVLDPPSNRSFETELRWGPPRPGGAAAEGAEDRLPAEVTLGTAVFSPGTGRYERRLETRHVHFIVFRDISERRRAQEALVLAAEKASEADRAKSEFIANVSHELRTPLNAIIGFSEILRKEMFGDLGAPEYVDYAADINLSGQHLLDVINDVLLVSKIEAGNHDLKERKLDVASVAEASLRIVRGYPKAASLNFVVEIPDKLPSLNADERAFRQILLNVLSNAVKFTPAGGRVHLGIRIDSLGGLVITVTDTGIGIPQLQVSHVTEPFFQVEGSMQRQYAGTGLGLNIVAKLADLHGAKLGIESHEGVGTAVSVRFPPERVISSENVVRLDIEKDRRQKG